MSVKVDISGFDDPECHVHCWWQRVTEYIYFVASILELPFIMLHPCPFRSTYIAYHSFKMSVYTISYF